MTDQAYVPRYNTISTELVAERGLEAAKSMTQPVATAAEAVDGRFDAFHRVLTWSILSVCLAVWAVLGFIFWVPLMLRSMCRFTLALSGSMLNGEQPVEAGRILRDTVSFYRRGFTVAIGAVFGDPMVDRRPAGAKKRAARMSSRDLLFEILWSAVFWYVVLLAFGADLPSPVEGWMGLFQFPWGEAFGMGIDRVLTLFGR